MADEVPVRGELLRWAREHQGYSRRQVRERGGPGDGIQREVEACERTTVRESHLSRWVSALNVTMEFARGEVPQYDSDRPDACYGLASDVLPLIPSVRVAGKDFARLDPPVRVREMLRLIATRSARLPHVVLAHLLDHQTWSTRGVRYDRGEITPELLAAVSQLTTLPEMWFIQAFPAPIYDAADRRAYLRAIRIALRADISPREVEELLVTHALTEDEPGWRSFSL